MRSVNANPLAVISFATALGLLVCSIANTLSRASEAPSPLLYWGGILLIALPIFYRLTSEEASVRRAPVPRLPARPLPLRA